MERVDAIYSDPERRTDINKWQSLLTDSLLDNCEIRDILQFRTFSYFAGQISNDATAAQSLPGQVTRLFAEYFGWINAEAQLTSSFGKKQIDLIFNHAYGKPLVAGARVVKSGYRAGGYSSLYRRLLITLAVCSPLIFYLLNRYAIDASRQTIPYYACKVLFTEQAKQQDYAACEAAAEYDDKAQLLFGLALLYSTKFPQDPVAAMDWLRKSANHANTRAMYLLGAIHGDGITNGEEIIKKDIEAAAFWLENAAKAGEMYAYTHLASLFIIQNRSAADIHSARQNLMLAADAEQPDAYLGMAMCEWYGLGSVRDFALARTWIDLYARTVIPTGTNEAAWLLATSPDEDFRAPAQALAYINLLDVEAAESARIMYLDTIAAVYAANGNFNQAVSYQEQAIAGLKKQQQPVYQDNIRGFQERLDFYQSNRTWTETLPDDYLQQRFMDLKNELYNRQLRALIMETQ